MGRIAASIGAAFGGGISTGISEKRRQDAQEKRDRDLAAAALLRIKEQRDFSQQKLEEQRTFNAGLQLQKDIAEDTTNRTLAASMDIKLQEGGLITNDIFSPTLTFKARKLAIDQKNKEAEFKTQEKQRVQELGLSISEKLIEASGKETPGGTTVTPGEKAGIIKSTGASPKQVSEIFEQVFGDEKKVKPPQFTPFQKDSLTQIRKDITKVEKAIDGREKELRKASEDVIAKTGRERVKTGGFLGLFQDEKLAQTDAAFLSSSLKSDSTLISLRGQLEELSTQEEEITSIIKPGILDGIIKNQTVTPDLKDLSIDELLNLGRTP